MSAQSLLRIILMLMFYWSRKEKDDATIIVVSVCFRLSLGPFSNSK